LDKTLKISILIVFLPQKMLYMILKVNSQINKLIISVLNKYFKLSKPRRDFIINILLLFLSIKGRLNFLQFGRFGNHKEQSYRQNFEKHFDFLNFNKQIILNSCNKHIIIAFDPSYISKSGKETYGLDKFWSGCASQVKLGLEIGGIAAIDIENNTAMHLEAIQTPTFKDLETQNISLVDWYADLIVSRKDTLLQLSVYNVVDAYFSKFLYVKKLTDNGFHIISRLRSDADLKYLYNGLKTGKRGRPKAYSGKIDFKNIDKNIFSLFDENENECCYQAIVYCKSLKRKIKLVYVLEKNQKASYKLYFSTDLELDAELILTYYRSRFQIEFLYRDAKQHTGLNDCQARSENKLYFHFNASLSAINLAKAEHWLNIPKKERGSFSMTDIKTMYHNMLLLERFIEVFAINPYILKNNKYVKELINFGKIAA